MKSASPVDHIEGTIEGKRRKVLRRTNAWVMGSTSLREAMSRGHIGLRNPEIND